MGAIEPFEPTLRAIAARCLSVAPESLDADAPLTRYGLDSLNAVELCVAITEATGIELTEDALLDAPTLAALAMHLTSPLTAHDPTDLRLKQMRADARLPDDIDPLRAVRTPCTGVLLTGATGFLGVHLLAALLGRGVTEVICLVRAVDAAHGRERVRATLRRYGVGSDRFDRCVRVIAADIGKSDLGLAPATYASLAGSVGTIYHCAAAVNWALPYEGLRAANVHATEALLRFACRGVRKDFQFVSSVAACYSTRNRGPVDETQAASDPAGIHLGYGQSKWVAKRLVEAAAARGLPATIYRPSLIAGASSSGLGNDDDFLARMLHGCIALGYAPEIDWRMDACPVDFVAAAIAALASRSIQTERIVHLRNPRHARWTEAILWMNLRGYPIVLEPFDTWIVRVEQATCAPSHPLHPLRGFLLNRPQGEGGRALPQLYADPNVARLSAERSDAALDRIGLECPRLGAALLERYFDAWVANGILPAVRHRQGVTPGARGLITDSAIEHALQKSFGDQGLRVLATQRTDLGSEHSILGELASWRAGSATALHGRTVEVERADGRRTTLDLVVKPKPADSVVLAVTAEVAGLCDPVLGAAFAEYGSASELAGGDQREIAIYAGARNVHGALQAHTPACFGVLQAEGIRALLLERIRDAELIDSVNETSSWSPVRIEAALSGIARIHAQWLGREQAVIALLGRGSSPDRESAAAAQAWRLALAQYARLWFERWIGQSGARNQLRLVEGAPSALAEVPAFPRTLIHNDFNPRNIALRRGVQGPALCAFDWELAAFGLPQRDLVELLCFVLAPGVAFDTIDHYVHAHRRMLERAAGIALDPDQWHDGVRLALIQFGIERLPMYFIAHRFRPQPFLERLTQTWQRMVNWGTCSPRAGAERTHPLRRRRTEGQTSA